MCPQRPDEQDHPLHVVSDERDPSQVAGAPMIPRLSGASSWTDPRGLPLSGVTALVAGLVLWKVWWWAGYPLGTFKPGLDGHGPDPYAWPRLLALWVPAAHALFGVAYVLLARGDPRGTLRRCFRADQWSLVLVLPLVASLALLGGQGPWRLMIGVWYTLFVGVKTGILLTGLWRAQCGEPGSMRRTGTAMFLGAFLPYLFLGAHVTTAMSTSSDEPYYLVVAHSLLHDGDLDLANNLAARDYLPFYWAALSQDRRAIRPTPDGQMFARLYQGFQTVLLLPGYAVAGRMGAVATTNALGAAALALTFKLALASGISRRSAFLAWLGAAFSVPLLVYSASPFPEVSGAFFAAAAAYCLWTPRATRLALAMAAGCLVAMVAAKTRLFLLVPPLALGFLRRFTWTTFLLALAGLGAAAAVASVYDTVFQSGIIVWQMKGGGVLEALRWFVQWTIWAPLHYRGHLGLLFDQEFGLLVAAPVFALALSGIVVALVQRRWRLVLLAGGPFVCTWYYLGAAVLGGMHMRGLSQWYGGFSPPARYLMASLPLLAILAALALDHVRGRIGWSLTAALFVLTLGYGAVVSVWPAWRFQSGLGRAVLFHAVFDRLGIDAGRWLPTFIAPRSGWEWPAVAALVLTLLAGYALASGPGRRAPVGTWLVGAIVAIVGTGTLTGAAWLDPAGVYPAVLGTGRGGQTFWGLLDVSAGKDTAVRERLVWATQSNGVLELAPRLAPGRYRVAVRVGAQGIDSGPSLALRLATEPPRRVGLETAAPPRWREQEYAFEVRWPGGRLPIRLELEQVSRQEPRRLAYVDSVEIERLPP
jgi:hypothetical protein